MAIPKSEIFDRAKCDILTTSYYTTSPTRLITLTEMTIDLYKGTSFQIVKASGLTVISWSSKASWNGEENSN